MDNRDDVRIWYIIAIALGVLTATALFLLYHPFVASAAELDQSEAVTAEIADVEDSEASASEYEDSISYYADSSSDLSITTYSVDDDSDTEEILRAILDALNESNKGLEKICSEVKGFHFCYDEWIYNEENYLDLYYNFINDYENIYFEDLYSILYGMSEDQRNFNTERNAFYESSSELLASVKDTVQTQADLTISGNDLLQDTNTMLQDISAATLVQSDLSVSGNALISDTNDILKTSSEENQQTNKDNMSIFAEYTTYILIFIGIVAGAVMGLILSNHLRKGT